MKILNEIIADDPAFKKSLEDILAVLHDPGYDVKRDMGGLIYEKLFTLFKVNNWGRRKAVGFLRHLFGVLNATKTNTDNINDDIGNFMDSLIGECSIHAVCRFQNDPEDLAKFKDYLYSYAWIEEEFYTGTL